MTRFDRERFRNIYPFARKRPIYAFINTVSEDDMATLEDLGIISVKQDPYNATGDGVTNDTSAISDALSAVQPGQALFFPSGTYLMGQMTISNKRDIEIFGYNSSILLHTTSAGFYMAGTCDNINIHNLKMIGNSTIADTQVGLSMNSGQNISNIIIEKMFITGTTIGISFNASSSGYIKDCVVVNNRIEGIVGINAGVGYGIHFADGTGYESRHQIINNRIARTNRHSIFCERGKGVLVQGNMINSHRLDASLDLNIRAAILITNSEDIICDGNIITDSFDPSITIDSNSVSIPTRNITLTNNHIVNPTTPPRTFANVNIGEDTQTGGRIENIKFVDNFIYSTGSTSAGLRMNAGHSVTIKNNDIILSGTSATTRGIELLARAESSLTSISSSNWIIENNTIKITNTGSLPISNPVRLGDLWLSSSVKTTFKNNIYNSVSSSFSLAASPINNPNVFIENDGIGIVFHTGSATGYYPIRNSNNTSENVAGLKGIILDNPSSTALSSLVSGSENQVVTLWFNNSNTRINNGTSTDNIQFHDGSNKAFSSGSSATFVRLNNVWRNASITSDKYFLNSLYVSGAIYVNGGEAGLSLGENADDLVVGNLVGNHGMTIVSNSGSAGAVYYKDTTGASNPGIFVYDHSLPGFGWVVEETTELLLINTSLLPGADLGLDLGGSSNRYATAYINTGSFGKVFNTQHPVYFPFSFSSLSLAEVFIPFADQTEASAANTVGARLVCPHSGSVNKVVMRSTADLSTTILRFYRNNTVLVASSSQAVGSGSLVTFTGDPTWTFTPTDFIGISIDPLNNLDTLDGMVVLNYNTNS